MNTTTTTTTTPTTVTLRIKSEDNLKNVLFTENISYIAEAISDSHSITIFEGTSYPGVWDEVSLPIDKYDWYYAMVYIEDMNLWFYAPYYSEAIILNREKKETEKMISNLLKDRCIEVLENEDKMKTNEMVAYLMSLKGESVA